MIMEKIIKEIKFLVGKLIPSVHNLRDVIYIRGMDKDWFIYKQSDTIFQMSDIYKIMEAEMGNILLFAAIILLIITVITEFIKDVLFIRFMKEICVENEEESIEQKFYWHNFVGAKVNGFGEVIITNINMRFLILLFSHC